MENQLWQAHWQFKNGSTQMRSQFEAADDTEFFKTMNSIRKNHPLPDGATWMWCNEKSPDFVLAVNQCEHGKGMTDYCQPCKRIHGS